jgi:hypothetical protein
LNSVKENDTDVICRDGADGYQAGLRNRLVKPRIAGFLHPSSDHLGRIVAGRKAGFPCRTGSAIGFVDAAPQKNEVDASYHLPGMDGFVGGPIVAQALVCAGHHLSVVRSL